jgi:predicted negative regulator of RcsB-dependent stress response
VADLEHEEQLERAREWWQKNGKSVIVGVVVAIVGAVGMQSWMTNQKQTMENASSQYSQLLEYMQSNKEKAAAQATTIIEEHGDTIYASQAALLKARLAVEKGDWDDAAAQLKWVTDNSDDEGFQHVARLRFARVLLQQNKTSEALELLIAVEHSTFVAEYQEIMGDAYLQNGDKDKARDAYEQAMAASAGKGNTRVLQMKLDDLAVSKDVAQ